MRCIAWGVRRRGTCAGTSRETPAHPQAWESRSAPQASRSDFPSLTFHILAPSRAARAALARAAASSAARLKGPLSQPPRCSRAIAASASIQPGRSFRHGIAWNALPPAARKVPLPSIPISSSVSRQSDTKPGQTTSMRASPLRPRLGEDHRRVRLQPLGAPEAGLESDLPRAVRKLELGRKQASGLLAFAVIRIAAVERVLRQTVKAHHEPIRTSICTPVFADEISKRTDEGGMIVIVLDDTQLGYVSRPRERRAHAIDRGSGCACRVLRIERQHEQAIAVRALKFGEDRLDRWLAIAHRVGDDEGRRELLAEQPLQQLGLARGVDRKRRPFRPPDRGVARGRAARTGIEDDPVQDRRPDGARDLDYPSVR